MLEKQPFKQISLYRLLTVLTAVFILSGCMGSATTTNQNAEIVTAFTGDLSASATAGGQLRAQRSATLSAAVPAVVTAVSVRVGDQVAAGDLLLQLDSTDLALNVATAEQTLRLQENNLNSLLAAPPRGRHCRRRSRSRDCPGPTGRSAGRSQRNRAGYCRSGCAYGRSQSVVGLKRVESDQRQH